MSEEEQSGSEYEEEEEEEVKKEAPPETPKLKKPPPKQDFGPAEKELSEGEKALMAAKKKQKAEEDARYEEYLDIRKVEREKEEEALRILRERQMARDREREEEARALAEARQANIEAREAEEEEMSARKEEEKRKRAAERQRRQQELAAILGQTGPQSDSTQAKSDMGSFGGGVTRNKPPQHWAPLEHERTDEEVAEAKQKLLTMRKPKEPKVGSLALDDLKKKAEELQARIVRMETEKYWMEKRMDRQAYDLKELGERQKQQVKQKAVKLGVDPELLLNQKHPQKMSVSSKYDRQIDSRSFDDRVKVFLKDGKDVAKAEVEAGGGGEAEPVAEQAAAEEEE